MLAAAGQVATVAVAEVLLPPTAHCLDAVLEVVNNLTPEDLAARVVLAPAGRDVEDSHALPPPTTAGVLERVFAEATGLFDVELDALFYPPAVDLWQGAIGGTFHGRRGLRHRYYMPRPDRVDQERYTAVGRLLAHCLVQPFAVPPIFPPFLYRWLLTSEPGAPTPSLDDLDLVDIATAQKLRLRLALSDPAQAEQHSETVR